MVGHEGEDVVEGAAEDSVEGIVVMFAADVEVVDVEVD